MKLLLSVVFLCGIGVKVWGSKIEEEVGCDNCYLQHYVAKNCTPEYGPNDSECPIRFNCPPSSPPETSGCRFQGKVIPPGGAIESSEPCNKCKCSPGDPRRVTCDILDCYSGPPRPGCYRMESIHSCCPGPEICVDDPGSRGRCTYEGKDYLAGEYIDPADDPSVVCTCGEGWTGDVHTDDRNCRRKTCFLGRYLRDLEEGCLPLYSKATCCPILFECGERIRNTTTPSATHEDIESGNSCVFKGSHYRIGQHLHIDLSPNWVATCACVTPPEFTCLLGSWDDSDD